MCSKNYKFDSHSERAKTTILPKHWTVNCLDKIGQRAITKEKKHLNIFRYMYIHYKHNHMEYKASFQASQCARNHKFDRRTNKESHNVSLLRVVYAIVCTYPFKVNKIEKQSKLCLPGSHWLSSFRELTKSIWILFLFQNFKELATVASENYLISAQVQSVCTEVTAHKNLLCF